VPILVSGIPAERPLGARNLATCGTIPDRSGRKPQLHAPSPSPLDNKLLASLPRKDFNALEPHLMTRSMSQGESVFEAGAEVDHVYFPHNGMFSLLAVMRDGEGVVGAMAGLGLYKSLVRVIVQLPLQTSKIAAAPFRKLVGGSDALRDVCVRYNEVMLTQARITAACNALHQIDERFCRWLLQSSDRAASDTVA
jgi:CRP-like cAMP-binding protein